MTDDEPLRGKRRAGGRPPGRRAERTARNERYRPLPTGGHRLDPEAVRHDQRRRLRAAMAELIAAKGYQAVRIADLARLAHVSPPTIYSLYADKQQLFIGAYEDVARRAADAVVRASGREEGFEQRLPAAMRAFGELAAADPNGVSLLVSGALGGGPEVLSRRRLLLERLERLVAELRDSAAPRREGDLIVRAQLGGIREVAAARLRTGREHELPRLAEEISRWVLSYPERLPDGLAAPADGRADEDTSSAPARRSGGALPSGRSSLPRQAIVRSQRERIVDATAAIVAEKGLPALTIPEIARRANVSHQTFYSIYGSKRKAFLGAQKVGMHQALRVTVEAYRAQEHDWPRAVAAGLRALACYLASEPDHARLTMVETYSASPQAIAIREAAMAAFRVYLAPGFERAPEQHPLVAEALVGGIWQLLHHYVERGRSAELPALTPQLTYFALTPFVGAHDAASIALAA